MNTLATLITSCCKKYPHRPFIYDRKGFRTNEYTYGEFYDLLLHVNGLFSSLGIKRGDRILLLGHSSVEYAALIMAAALQGVTVVPLDIQSDTSFIAKVASQTKPKAFFTSRKVNLKIKTIRFEDVVKKSLECKKKKPARTSPTDVIEILFTSGTTGHPKGVVLSHENFMATLDSFSRAIWLPQLRFISVLPLSHIFEQTVGLFFPFSRGCSILYPGTLRPSRLTELIRNKQINAMATVPSLLASLKQPRVLRNLGPQFFMIGVGGAKLDPELQKYWKHRLKIVLQGYGATETTACIASTTLLNQKKGSVGTPFPGVHVKLVDGEIWVKAKNIFSEYYKEKKKTSEVLESGWYKTGDQGGFKGKNLFISGRKKDMIVTKNGENVFPDDIEKILNREEDIKESCVIEHNGNIKAYVIANKKIDLSGVISSVNGKLQQKQQIAEYDYWPKPTFPKTPIGKIRKFLVVQESKGTSQTSDVYSSKVKEILSTLTVKKPKDKSQLGKDLLLDSLKIVQLLSRIESELGVELQEDAVTEKTTVKQLENLILNHEQVETFLMDKWSIIQPLVFFRRVFHELIMFPMMRVWWRVEIKGRENLQDLKRPVIFMPNHQTHADMVVFLMGLPFSLRKKLAAAASPPLLFGIPPPKKGRIIKRFQRWIAGFLFNTFPFGVQIGLERSLTITGELLDRGFSLVVYPEGKLTRDGNFNEFQEGAGFLAKNMDVDVVPVRLRGLYELYPLGQPLPKPGRVSIEFGKPLNLRNKSIVEATRMVRKAVESM